MKIKRFILDNFKGVAHGEYDTDGNIVSLIGTNGVGKTTLATAFLWCLCDKEYNLSSNPNIRPDDDRECIPTVTLVCDFDGKEVTISKMQKMKVGKPDANGISKTTLTNSYEINSVPKSERDFKAYLEDLNIQFDNFLPCSHTEVFTGQKQADMRKKLFEMSGEKTDYDIASDFAREKAEKEYKEDSEITFDELEEMFVGESETADVARLLKSYTYTEIEAMNKASKKKAVEQSEAIPNQIIGLEKAKVEIDVAELELANNGLTEKIAEVDERIKSGSKVVDDLEQKKFELQFEINDCKRKANDSLIKQKRDIENQQYEVNNKFADLHQKISIYDRGISEKKSAIERLDKERLALKEPYMKLHDSVFTGTLDFDESAFVFDESSTVCSLCGQVLPKDKIEALKEDFDTRKADEKAKAEKDFVDAKERFKSAKESKLERIVADGNEKKSQIATLKSEIEELEKNLPALRAQETEAMKLKNDLESKLAELPNEVDLSGNEEYQALIKKDADLDSQISSAKANSVDTSSLENEKSTLEEELEKVKSEIAQSVNNVRIDEQIADLEQKKLDYEQAKADAEKILYQLSLVSKKKNGLLVGEINSHFSIVKWMLFDYQKNGEYKEVCVPLINGKKFGDTTNTGLEIIARLDICNSFQKFYGMQVPIFLDHASIIDKALLPQLDTQLFLLVNEPSQKTLKVEVE